MSTLTKIFVVVFVVLAIFSSVTFIAYVNYTANFKEWGEGQNRLAGVANAQAQARATQLKNLQVAYESLQKSSAADAEALRGDRDTLKQAMDTANAQLAQAQSAVESLKASFAGLQASLAEQTAMQKELTKQLATANKLTIQQNVQLGQYEQTTKEQTLEREQLLAQVRSYKEQVDNLRAQVESNGGLATTAGPGKTAAMAAKIDATILTVKNNLAEVNVGSADGVIAGMRFHIFRGDKLVGELEVAEVDASSAAGVLSDVQMTPQRGDKATTSLK